MSPVPPTHAPCHAAPGDPFPRPGAAAPRALAARLGVARFAADRRRAGRDVRRASADGRAARARRGGGRERRAEGAHRGAGALRTGRARGARRRAADLARTRRGNRGRCAPISPSTGAWSAATSARASRCMRSRSPGEGFAGVEFQCHADPEFQARPGHQRPPDAGGRGRRRTASCRRSTGLRSAKARTMPESTTASSIFSR